MARVVEAGRVRLEEVPSHKKLVWYTVRRGEVIDFWVAFSEVLIVVRRLIREGWIRYRWESRPLRRP
jgi:hypothetical protein